MITLAELTQRLELDSEQIDELIRRGMPRAGDKFDELAVRSWLIDQGLATEAIPTKRRSIEDIEREDVDRARAKLDAGERPTAAEAAALKRFEKERLTNERWAIFCKVSKKEYCRLAGTDDKPRPVKVLLEQAERYDLPLDGAFVNLRLIIRGFHDLLAKHKHKFSDDSEPDKSGDPSLLELRSERAAIARMDRLEREGQLLPKSYVLDGLMRIATIVRGLGDQLARDYDDEARLLLDAALDDAEREINTMFTAE